MLWRTKWRRWSWRWWVAFPHPQNGWLNNSFEWSIKHVPTHLHSAMWFAARNLEPCSACIKTGLVQMVPTSDNGCDTISPTTQAISVCCNNVGPSYATLIQHLTSLPENAWKKFPNQHDTLSQCWFNVVPPSATMAQQKTNIGSICRANWAVYRHITPSSWWNLSQLFSYWMSIRYAFIGRKLRLKMCILQKHYHKYRHW